MPPKKKLLHITPWFPNQKNPNEAIWIKRHIEALGTHFENHVLHLDLKNGRWKFQLVTNENFDHFQITCPNTRWIEKELIVFFALIYYFIFKKRPKEFQCLNFHIAYPNFVYIHLIQAFIKSKFLITEHWSIYHFKFHSQKKLYRIRNIFRRQVPLITVSKALQKDISKFCSEDINAQIVPNIVDTSNFNFQELEQERFVLMGSFWKEPKTPIPIIEAFSQVVEKHPKLKLRIFGYGPMEEEIKMYISNQDLSKSVEWLGKKNSQEISALMNRSKGFIHASEYETFSVVCAEALCCGTPLLASDVGALPELVNSNNGILKRDDESWISALNQFLNRDFHRKDIASEAANKYSPMIVGKRYAEIIKSL